MKKNYLFAIAIAALLFSCTKESVDNSSINMNDNSISFDTYTTVSKGTPIISNVRSEELRLGKECRIGWRYGGRAG